MDRKSFIGISENVSPNQIRNFNHINIRFYLSTMIDISHKILEKKCGMLRESLERVYDFRFLASVAIDNLIYIFLEAMICHD